MTVVTLDLYPGAGGRYPTEIRIGPGLPWADLAAESASLYLEDPPAPVAGLRRLSFRPAVAYPLGLEPLRGTRGLLYVYLYRPTDHDAILAFDRRINARYSEFFVTAGEYPAGTYDVEGLSAPCIGELARIDAASRAEWNERSAALEVPADIEAILSECRELQDRSYERYVIWMTLPRE
jgi:hypothetical protein